MHIPSFSFLGHLDDTFAGGWFAGRPAGRPAKPEINANLSPAWLAGACAELGNKLYLYSYRIIEESFLARAAVLKSVLDLIQMVDWQQR